MKGSVSATATSITRGDQGNGNLQTARTSHTALPDLLVKLHLFTQTKY